MPDIYCGRKIKRRQPARFDLTGDALCLDFINTLDDRFTDEPKELLASYIDLAHFAEDTGILEPLEADRLVVRGQTTPEAAQSALAAAIQLREAMNKVFWAVLNKEPVPRGALATLNRCVHDAAQHSQLVETRRRFCWKFDDALDHLEAPLWPIASSAADLLASDQLHLVRACAAKNCLWLFLDTSKNHRRRWCDMTKCGNRAKFRRYYKRQKKAGAES
jgi:predicted RNA-binding Zn ribbon-like protein